MAKNAPKGLKIFLEKIIDYAGTYPPANLDLKTVFNNYLEYIKDSPYKWMLSKFVCSSSNLNELDKIIRDNKIAIEKPVTFTIIGSSSVHSSEFLYSLITFFQCFHQFDIFFLRVSWQVQKLRHIQPSFLELAKEPP